MHDAHLSWCVDDGNEFLEMPANETVVENPVLILQALEERVLAERLLAHVELGVCATTLLLEGVYAIREVSGEAKRPAFRGGKRGALVKPGMDEDGVSAEGDTKNAVGGSRHRRR